MTEDSCYLFVYSFLWLWLNYITSSLVLYIFSDCAGRLYDEVKDLKEETKDLVTQEEHREAATRAPDKIQDVQNAQIPKAQFIIGGFYSFSYDEQLLPKLSLLYNFCS